MDLLFLGEPDCQRVELVGGKVAPLSRLAANYRVPPGFCLTTSAFAKWAPAGAKTGSEALGLHAARLEHAYVELGRRCDAKDLANGQSSCRS